MKSRPLSLLIDLLEASKILEVGDRVSFTDDSISSMTGVVSIVFKKGDSVQIPGYRGKVYSAYDEMGGPMPLERQQEAVDYTNCYVIDASPNGINPKPLPTTIL